MSNEHETDIYWFKKGYKYLTEERGWKVQQVDEEVGFTRLTTLKIARATKNSIPKLNASSWAKIQDFVKKWKEDVLDPEDVSDAEMREGIHHILEENGVGRNMEAKEVQPMLLAEADQFDLLRALSQCNNVKLSIAIEMN